MTRGSVLFGSLERLGLCLLRHCRCSRGNGVNWASCSLDPMHVCGAARVVCNLEQVSFLDAMDNRTLRHAMP